MKNVGAYEHADHTFRFLKLPGCEAALRLVLALLRLSSGTAVFMPIVGQVGGHRDLKMGGTATSGAEFVWLFFGLVIVFRTW